MALPTTYDESSLKQYMEDVLGKTADKLGWSVANDDFDEPVFEVLFILDRDDFSYADNNRSEIRKIRIIARQEVWRAAMYYTAHEASFSTGAPGTGQTTRNTIHEHCKTMFEKARSEVSENYPDLASDSGSWAVERYPIRYDGDYYDNIGESVS